MSRLLTYSEEQPGVRRGLGLGAVILFHALLVWALASGLAQHVVEVVKAPLEVSLLEETTPDRPETPPPPPPPKLIPPPTAFVPPPEITIAPPTEPPPTAITNVQAEKKPEPQEPRVTPPRGDPSDANTQPPYPPAARRGGQEGKVVLLLSVSETGEVVDGSIARTSGYPLLDNAALNHALRKWHFKPATKGGIPVPYALRFTVTFRLTG